MGRELRRKQAKKEGKSLQREEIVEKNQIRNFIITTVSVLVVLGLIYVGSALFITKELNWFGLNSEEDTTETDTSNEIKNTILAKQIFKQKEEEYYVYFYDFDNAEDKLQITNMVNDKLTDEKVYKVDISDALNSNYVTETESNKKAKKLEDLKVKNYTLIKISADKIVEYYEENEIIKELS